MTARTAREKLVHELRHPLSVILLWEQIARASDSPKARDAALDAIRAAVLQQAAMLDRFERSARPSRTGSRKR